MGSDTPHIMGIDRTFDEGMKQKINDTMADLRNVRSKYLDQMKKAKEEAIYKIIRIYSIGGGISHQKLADISDLDRKSLRPYTKNLLDNNLIKRNSHGLYESLEEFFKDSIDTATVFGESVAFKLLGIDKPLILNSDSNHIVFTIDQRKSATYDFTQYRRFFQPQFTKKDILKQAIFEFSNRIGSFIVYLLMYSMNPLNKPKQLSPKETDRITERMVETGIRTFIPTLLWRFRDFIYKSIHAYPTDYHSRVEFMKKEPRFSFTKQLSLQLIDAFTWIYPMMSYEFERILPIRYEFKNVLTGWPSVIEGHRRYMESFHSMLKKQESCKHQYGKPVKTLYGFIGQQCKQCQHIRKVKKSELRSIDKKRSK